MTGWSRISSAMGRPRTAIGVAVALAVIACLPNFLFPFFEDAALYSAIGRLMGDGVLPYRDALDQKPPGIYWTMYLVDLLLGRSSIASRVAELAAILAMAFACGKIARHVTGTLALPLGIAVVGCLSSGMFWSSAERGQVEWYQAAVGAWGLAFAVASLSDDRRRTLILAGSFLALACWFKPQAAGTALLVTAALAARHAFAREWRAALRTAGWIAAGAGIASAPFLLWMLATGILDDFLHVMFVANPEYLQHEATPSIPEAMARLTLWPWIQDRTIWALRIAVAAGVVAFIASGERRRERMWIGGLVGLWCVGSFGQYVSGRYLFRYHSVIMLPCVAVLIACGLMELRRLVRHLGRDHLRPGLQRAVIASGALALAVLLVDNPKYAFEWKWLARWTVGDASTGEVYAMFGRRLHYYRFTAQLGAAHYVRAHTGPDDRVQVIGRGGTFSLYVDRKPASRYLVTNGVFDERRAHHEQKLAELTDDLKRNRPAYILVRHDDEFPWFGLDSSDQMLLRAPALVAWLESEYEPDGLWEDSAYVFRRKDLPP